MAFPSLVRRPSRSERGRGSAKPADTEADREHTRQYPTLSHGRMIFLLSLHLQATASLASPLCQPPSLALFLLFHGEPCPVRKPLCTHSQHDRAFELLLRARGHQLLSRATTEGRRLLWIRTHSTHG